MTQPVKDDLYAYNAKLLEYNVNGGKLTRGLTVVHCVVIMKDGKTPPELLQKTEMLGWCCEILQGLLLVADDIMDSSETRRHKPCWYRLLEIGTPNAINDTLGLFCLMMRLVDKYFGKEPSFHRITTLIAENVQKTVFGQYLDTNIKPPEAAELDLTRYTMDRYRATVLHKTAYYSFYLPLALGMTASGVTEEYAFQYAKEFSVEIGEYFQIQDDYLDCYGDPEVIGKIGTDIEEGKCSWLACKVRSGLSIETSLSL
eukprot:GHVN01080479.1.p1 GENE.GHVN01080479.1~~GHVN01080479.1.p1  ORF type:complete len:300 (+),score=21.17 GHVN01080479.1:131-901(+)